MSGDMSSHVGGGKIGYNRVMDGIDQEKWMRKEKDYRTLH